MACFQKNEIISNFSGIYFWPLPFRVGSEFDKISGCVPVICRQHSRRKKESVFEGCFLFFVCFCYFFGFLCFLKSISITKTVRMNRTLACFQKNEIISNFSRIYFWPLFFQIGSEFDKISGWVGCKSIPILSSHP